MHRTGRTRSGAVGLAAMVLVAAACGDSGEKGLEQLIEQETGEDVQIDFEDGGINVQTDEGSFTVDEEGNFTAVGEDGEVFSGNVDAGSDGLDIEGSSDDGEISFETGGEIPEDWPNEVPRPTGLMVLNGSTFSDGDQFSVTVVGTFDGEPAAFVSAYASALADAGFPETGRFESNGSLSTFHETETWVVTVAAGPPVAGDGASQITISVISAA